MIFSEKKSRKSRFPKSVLNWFYDDVETLRGRGMTPGAVRGSSKHPRTKLEHSWEIYFFEIFCSENLIFYLKPHDCESKDLDLDPILAKIRGLGRDSFLF